MTPSTENKDKNGHSARVAMVTGVGGAMGAAIARSLLNEGYRVVLADADRPALEAVTAALGEGTFPILFDLSDATAIHGACEQVREKVGPVDVLVNNAGVLSNHKLQETNPDEWRKIMAVNLDGPYHLSREWVPSMRERKWGRIINMCSVAMKTGGLTAGTAYTASKGALGGLTFSLARELAPHGVTVNAIAPAYVKTKMITEQLTEEQRQNTLKQIPVGRFCEPEEIAHAVVFLASPLAGFITGELLDINGGLHLD